MSGKLFLILCVALVTITNAFIPVIGNQRAPFSSQMQSDKFGINNFSRWSKKVTAIATISAGILVGSSSATYAEESLSVDSTSTSVAAPAVVAESPIPAVAVEKVGDFNPLGSITGYINKVTLGVDQITPTSKMNVSPEGKLLPEGKIKMKEQQNDQELLNKIAAIKKAAGNTYKFESVPFQTLAGVAIAVPVFLGILLRLLVPVILKFTASQAMTEKTEGKEKGKK